MEIETRNKWFIAIGAICIMIVLYNIRTILPFMESDEFVTETMGKSKVIHTDDCTLYKRRFLKRKHNIMDLRMRKEHIFCHSCFFQEKILLFLYIDDYNKFIEREYDKAAYGPKYPLPHQYNALQDYEHLIEDYDDFSSFINDYISTQELLEEINDANTPDEQHVIR